MGATIPDEMHVIKGFKIEITSTDGSKEVDTAWESCTGGALCIEVTPASPGVSDPNLPPPGTGQLPVATPGHKFVEEIQLRGPMTQSRKWIAKNINNTIKDKFVRFDLTVIEINKDGSDGKRYTYNKCFLTRYVYPVLSADGTGNLYEEVSIKPERLSLG